jgi:hypothetical protein
MLDSFKQDMNSNLPRQVRALVQQVHGAAHGKCIKGSPNAFSMRGSPRQGNQGTLANVSQPNLGTNLNLQQPFYQTMAYGPNIPPMGSGIPHGPVP